MKKKQLSRLLSFVMAVSVAGTLCSSYVSAEPAESSSGVEVSLEFEEVTDGSVTEMVLDDAKVDPDEGDEDTGEAQYEDGDILRVSIVLEEDSTVEAGYDIATISEDEGAIEYREELYEEQVEMTEVIEDAINDELDIVWNLTLAANLISANVEYGQIETIEAVDGVDSVVIECLYEPAVIDEEETSDPLMATSSAQIGSAAAWAEGYTGAGSRIAVIDTGIDADHQSFDSGALEYSLAQNAAASGEETDAYVDSLNLLDTEELAEKWSQLNVSTDYSSDELYYSSKIPFAYNYIDVNLDITHDNDSQGAHGSHVEGIAAANAYIPNGDGTYADALDTVYVQGVAPDAQILSMKVFGTAGGAYESDYMAAIEDAIVLKADAINLSLGSASTGFTTSTTYQGILDSLTDCGAVISIAAGNAYNWPYYIHTSGLYTDDVNFDRVGSPASYTNSLAVASVQNAGSSGVAFALSDGSSIIYTEAGNTGTTFSSLEGEQQYVVIDGYGAADEVAALADILDGKVAVISRGGNITFSEKANAAAESGAAAVVIYNNESGTLSMDLSDYTGSIPVVAISQDDGALMKAAATEVSDEETGTTYYAGTLTVTGLTFYSDDSEYYTMSASSSWGIPGSLELKPEITAPGGGVYSVDGSVSGGTAYTTMSGTSMATPQVSGMVAVVAQYIRDNGLEESTGLSVRQLAQSLLMSTAEPLYEEESGSYYSILRQGSGLANVGDAVTAKSYILMGEDATDSASDGKVKAELGDDPDRDGEYEFSFTINNFSDEDVSYTLSGDFFTQDVYEDDGEWFLDELTTSLAADTSFTVDGTVISTESGLDHDLDLDGDTDANDAQIILNYLTGQEDSIDEETADVDGDGSVTTYDAYLILSDLSTRAITVAAGASVNVTVSVVLSDFVKKYLDRTYDNGAYLEGYVYATPIATSEGVIPDSTHSIPVLGFYGNWTDPNMFEITGNAEAMYGNTTSYSGYLNTNSLIYKKPGGSLCFQIGNPYLIEDEYPADRLAISGSDTIYSYRYSLIRNAAAVVGYIADEDGNIVDIGVKDYSYAEYAVSSSGSLYWYNAYASYQFQTTPTALGFSDGEQITVGVAAIPEYYAENGTLTEEEAEELIRSGVLGDGAFLSTTMTVDSVAPTITSVTRDEDTGEITVTAQDENYIAAAGVMNLRGTVTYAIKQPEQTEAGSEVEITFDADDLSEVTGGYLTVVVADYASNERTYSINLQTDTSDYNGNMYVFTTANSAYSYVTQVWPSANDFAALAKTDFKGIQAAEYVNGYVYFAAGDGCLYVTPMGSWDDYKRLGYYSDVTSSIRDMAYNYADGKLYLLDGTTGDGTNVIYSVDLLTGEMTKEMEISITHPNYTTVTFLDLMSLAIDDDGNFYAVNYYTASTSVTSRQTYLYSWSAEDLTEGEDGVLYLSDLAPVNNSSTGYTKYNSNTYGGSLAWDHDNDVLYWVTSTGSSTNYSAYLKIFDTTDGTITSAMTSTINIGRNTGLFIVPEGETTTIEASDTATSIRLSDTSLSLLEGTSATVTTEVFPWTLEDTSVTWSSADPSIATVNSSGTITGVSEGTTTVTATTSAEPHLTADVTVTVGHVDGTTISGLVTGTDGYSWWKELATDTLTATATMKQELNSYVGGAVLDGKIYARDTEYNLYSIDADTFEAETSGTFASAYTWNDMAGADTVYDETYGELFGILLAPYLNTSNQQYLAMLDPDGQLIKYVSITAVGSDPVVAIACCGDSTYGSKAYPQKNFYMVTQSGDVYSYGLYSSKAGSYLVGSAMTKVSSTGLTLTDAATLDNGVYTSMVYDEDSGLLYLLYSGSGDDGASASMLYAIDPKTGKYVNVSASDDTVSFIYQYDRITDLTVQMLSDDAEIYETETVQLSARVLPTVYQDTVYQNKVTWTSSDETIAVVDENGLVTGVGEGTATITATSVDKNESGETASDTVDVTVKALKRLTGSASAMVTTDSGTYWSSIDLTDVRNLTTGTQSSVDLLASAYNTADGKIYGIGTDDEGSSWFYRLDTANSLAVEKGAEADYTTVRGATYVPAAQFTVENAAGETVAKDVFDCAAFLADSKLQLLTDFAAGETVELSASTYSLLSGLAYVGTTETDGVPTAQFLVVTAGSSTSYYAILLSVAPSYDAETDSITYTSSYKYGRMWDTALGGAVYLTDYTSVSLDYYNDGTSEGLLMAAVRDDAAELWFIDCSAEVRSGWASGQKLQTDYMGTVTGASDAYGVYTGMTPSAETAEAFLEAFAVQEATETEASSWIPMDMTMEEVLAAAEEQTEGVVRSSGGATEAQAANAVTGSTQSISAQSLDSSSAAFETIQEDESAGVTLTLTEDRWVRNGLITVTYDPAKLTYSGITSSAQYAVNVDEEKGEICFAYATAEPITTGSAIAEISFDYTQEHLHTDVTLQTAERNRAFELTEKNEIAVADHAYEAVVTAVTCTSDGYTTYTCSVCGDTYVDDIVEATGHDYVETVIEPTCTGSGKTEHKCSVCGNLYYTDLTPATGHNYVEDTGQRVDATCTEDGSVTYVCSVCGDSFTDTLAATGHSWDAGVVTKAATATEEGEITFTCTLCGETCTEVTEAIATVGDTVVLRSGNIFSFWYTLESDGPDLVLDYGRAGDEVLIGDWDGDGIDTICVRRGNKFYFKNDFSSGDAEYVITYGREGDEVLVGDWDGDGTDTLAVRRNGNVYYFKYTIDSGDADAVITYGRAADEVLIGDWDGDGFDTLAVRRNGNIYYFKNSIESGASDNRISYGRDTDEILVGDWDGDGTDTLCARRKNVYYFSNSVEDSESELVYTYGDSTDESFAGRWR